MANMSQASKRSKRHQLLQMYGNRCCWLRNLADWLVEELELYRDEPSATANLVRPPAFLGEVLWAIAQHKNNPQAIYRLLKANLDKLNDNFYEQFRHWVNFSLLNSESTTAQVVAIGIIDFCTMLCEFPLGNRAINLEISITGLEAATKIFTREILPEIWAQIQTNLAPAYRHRILGNRADNQEKAIAACNNGLFIYTRDAFPEQWASLQSNLGLVYTDRITGDKAENLEKAIACYQNALLIRTREDFPELWAQTQMNLASAYRHRLRGDAAENVEMAIAAHQAALQVYTKAAFPTNWGEVQNNLANAYLHSGKHCFYNW